MICIISDRIAIHSDFHQRQIFTGDASCQGTEGCLHQVALWTEQQFFKTIIFSALAFAGDKSTGLCEQYIISGAGNFQTQFIDHFKI